jgi:protein TonB
MFRATTCSFVVLLTVLNVSIAAGQSATNASSPVTTGQTYLDFQVEHPVRMKDPVPPAYPTHLRKAGIEGLVVAQFVVDERGAAMMSTFKVVESDDVAFTESVKRAVNVMKFEPAEVGGRKVRQLVQQHFKFKASR